MDIKSRLNNIESKIYSDPIIIEATDSNGIASIVTVNEMIQKGLYFSKIISGSRLSDLDNLLHHIRAQAFEDLSE